MLDTTSKRKRHVSVRFRKQWRRKTFSQDNFLNPVSSKSMNREETDNPSQSEAQGRKNGSQNASPVTSTRCEKTGSVCLDDPLRFDSEGSIEDESDSGDDHMLGTAPSDDAEQHSDPIDSYDPCAISDVMLRKRVPSALCLIVGRDRLTAAQYKKVRSFLNFEGDFGRKEGYPSYSSLQGKVFPVMKRHVYVQSETKRFQRSGSSMEQQSPVKIVFPGSWAVKDISSYPIFTSAIETSSRDGRKCPELMYSLMVSVPALGRPLAILRADIVSYVMERDKTWVSGSEFGSAPSQRIKVIVHAVAKRCLDLLSGIRYETKTEEGSRIMKFEGVTLSTTLKHVSEGDIIAGDVVTHLKVEYCPPEIILYLVHRMKRNTGQPQQSLLIRLNNGDNRKLVLRCKRVLKCWSTTEAVPRPLPLPHVHTYGKLKDGRLNSVYRFILYSDDFQQFSHEKGSAGGCYMLPVRFPLQQRKGSEAVRVIGLTPPGISTNQVISSIIPDIVNGMHKGFEALDYFGVKHTVFLEVVGYIGDYVAVQHVQDLTGPRGIAPCPLCTFTKGSSIGNTTTEYAYTTNVHSGNASFRRDKLRMRAMRNAGADENDLRQIGLRNITFEQESKLPLHLLSDALDRIREDVPRTSEDKPVVSAFFDPNLSTLVAPDHLLCGVGEDIINANMRLLSKQGRIIAESLIKHALRSNGLPCESQVYNHDKLQLHSMSISAMYSILLVAPWSLYMSAAFVGGGLRNKRCFLSHQVTRCLSILLRFQTLVADTLYFPICDVDGKEEVVRYNISYETAYLASLKRDCATLIKEIIAVASINDIARKEMDKPNIHRLLELYNHTIPLVGHVKHCQELLFEASHQPLKSGLKQSNNRNAQLTAMDDVLANDWKLRVAFTIQYCNISESGDLSDQQCNAMKRVICGDKDLPSEDILPGLPSRIRKKPDKTCY